MERSVSEKNLEKDKYRAQLKLTGSVLKSLTWASPLSDSSWITVTIST